MDRLCILIDSVFAEIIDNADLQKNSALLVNEIKKDMDKITN